MTVPEKHQRKRIAATGFVNPLTHDVYLESASHLKVYADDAQLVLGVDYTVGSLLDAAGYVVNITIPDPGYEPSWWGPDYFILSVEPPIEQASDVSLGGQFGKRYETALDAMTRRVQHLSDVALRALKMPRTTSTTVEYEVPAPVANKVIGWNDTADGLALYDNLDGLAAAAAAAASAVAAEEDAAAAAAAVVEAEAAAERASAAAAEALSTIDNVKPSVAAALLAPPGDGVPVVCGGRDVAGDMPAVTFVHTMVNPGADNGGTIRAVPGGGWLVCADTVVDARLFGVFPNGADVTAKLTAALASGKKILLDGGAAGDYYPITSIPAAAGSHLEGVGPNKPVLRRTTLELEGGIYLRDSLGGLNGITLKRLKLECRSPNEVVWTAGPGDVGGRAIPWVNTCRAATLTDMVIVKNGSLLNLFGTSTTFTGTAVALAASLPAHANGDVYKLAEVRSGSRVSAFYSEGTQANWNSGVFVEDCEAHGFWYCGFERAYTRDATFIRNKTYGVVNRPFYTYLGNSGGVWDTNYCDGKFASFSLLAGVKGTDYADQVNASSLGDIISDISWINPTYIDCFGRGWSTAGNLGAGVTVTDITVSGCGFYGILTGEVGALQGARPKISGTVTGGSTPVYLLAACDLEVVVAAAAGPGPAVIMLVNTLSTYGGKESDQKVKITVGALESPGQIVGPAVQIIGYAGLTGYIRAYDGTGAIVDLRDCAQADVSITAFGGAYTYLNGVTGHVRATAKNPSSHGVYALACPNLKLDAHTEGSPSNGVLIGAGCNNAVVFAMIDSAAIGLQIAAGSSYVSATGSAKGNTIGNAVTNNGTSCNVAGMIAHT